MRKILGDTDLSDHDPTPKKNQRTKLRRSFAIADIAALASNAESENEVLVLNNELEYARIRPRADAADEADEDTDQSPTPRKKQKTIKVPVREAIKSNRKEHEPRKADNSELKVSSLHYTR